LPQTTPVNRATGRWWGRTVCIIAGGPSLTKEDCDLIASSTLWKCIAVNDSWQRLPTADVIYACDGAWWKVHHEKVKKEFKGERWTQDYKTSVRFGLNRVGSAAKPGLGKEGIIHQGGNGGYQVINLAWLWGAKRILAIGLDCKPAADGTAHWFGQHGRNLSKIQNYRCWNELFPQLAADLVQEGVDVFNLSRETALTCFPRMSLEEAISKFKDEPK
jgi:hypothetical protein